MSGSLKPSQILTKSQRFDLRRLERLTPLARNPKIPLSYAMLLWWESLEEEIRDYVNVLDNPDILEEEGETAEDVYPHMEGISNLYVMKSPTGIYKSGMSVDPEKRLRQLRRVHPGLLLIGSMRTPARAYGQNIDQLIHFASAYDGHIENEWFSKDSMVFEWLTFIGMRWNIDPHLEFDTTDWMTCPAPGSSAS